MVTNTDLLDPNPFAKSILAEKGDATAREIYTDVGFALDRWEPCDTDFGVLYSSIINPQGSNHVLMRSFGMITSPKTKRDMIWAANDAYFAMAKNDDLKKQVRHLLNLYSDAAARRNEIAHAIVMGEMRHTIVNKVAVPLPTIWFLVPPLFATRKTEMHMRGPKYRYSTHELSHFSKCFEELSSRAMKLTQLIREFHASSDEKQL